MKIIKEGYPPPKGQGVWIVLALIMMLFGDSLVGHAYHKLLCTTRAGTYTFKQIELGSEYWTENGLPNFYSSRDGIIGDNVNARVGRHRDWGDSGLGVTYRAVIYKSTDADEVLLKDVTYFFRGGWFVNNMQPFHVTASTCKRSGKSYTSTDPKIGKDDLGVNPIKKIFISSD